MLLFHSESQWLARRIASEGAAQAATATGTITAVGGPAIVTVERPSRFPGAEALGGERIDARTVSCIDQDYPNN